MKFFTAPIQRTFGDKTGAQFNMSMGDFEHHKAYKNRGKSNNNSLGHDSGLSGGPSEENDVPKIPLGSPLAWSMCCVTLLFVLAAYALGLDRATYQASGVVLINSLLVAVLGKQYAATALPIIATVGMFSLATPLFDVSPSQPAKQAKETTPAIPKVPERPSSEPDVILKDRRAVIPEF
jgi:hypothetical protein